MRGGALRLTLGYAEVPMSSFTIYLIGMLLVIGGLAYVAWMLHTPTHWLIAGVVVMLGLGVLGAVKSTRRRDPPGP